MSLSPLQPCSLPIQTAGPRRSGRLASSGQVGVVRTSTVTVAASSAEILSPTERRKRVRANSLSSLSALTEVSSVAPTPKKKKARKRGKTKADESGQAGENKEKTPRKRRAEHQVVYVIADVEQKETNFKGRLGYACLNTILRNMKPADEAIFCSRTCRIATIKEKGSEYVQELASRNVQDLLTMIQWNEDNHIRFMRISSNMFPFGSHVEYGYNLTPYAEILGRIGALAKQYGHRLTTHPGQYVQLGSPSQKVLDASIRELRHHCEFLDLMGIDKDGVCIVHGGGVYGDKQATLDRIKTTITSLLPQNVRDRLVLENDEICFSAEDLLPLCEELDVPLVFDHHHDALKPSSIPPSTIISRTNAIFARRGIRPKQHVSEARPGAVTLMERRAHSDRVQTLPDCGEEEVDLMIEAKDKEQAVLHLYRMYGLAPVNHASLRPPAKNETMQTKGRKSDKLTRAKAPKVSEADANREESG